MLVLFKCQAHSIKYCCINTPKMLATNSNIFYSVGTNIHVEQFVLSQSQTEQTTWNNFLNVFNLVRLDEI